MARTNWKKCSSPERSSDHCGSKADKFDALYGLRSNFLHDGSGRDSLGDAADATLEIAYTLEGI